MSGLVAAVRDPLAAEVADLQRRQRHPRPAAAVCRAPAADSGGPTPGDDTPGGAPVALLGEALWKRRFGSDLAIIGQPALVNGTSYTIVGIAPAALTVLTNGEIFVPLAIDPAKEIRLNHVLSVVGRLEPGVGMETAQDERDAIAIGMIKTYPEPKDWGVNFISFTETFVSRQLRTDLLVLARRGGALAADRRTIRRVADGSWAMCAASR